MRSMDTDMFQDLLQSIRDIKADMAGKTLQNWEQHRTRHTDPARALLKMLAKDPKAAIELLAV